MSNQKSMYGSFLEILELHQLYNEETIVDLPENQESLSKLYLLAMEDYNQRLRAHRIAIEAANKFNDTYAARPPEKPRVDIIRANAIQGIRMLRSRHWPDDWKKTRGDASNGKPGWPGIYYGAVVFSGRFDPDDFVYDPTRTRPWAITDEQSEILRTANLSEIKFGPSKKVEPEQTSTLKSWKCKPLSILDSVNKKESSQRGLKVLPWMITAASLLIALLSFTYEKKESPYAKAVKSLKIETGDMNWEREIPLDALVWDADFQEVGHPGYLAILTKAPSP